MANPSYSQNLEGRYEGAVSRDGSVQLISFDFFIEKGVQKGTYEIPENGSFDVQIDEIGLNKDTLNIKFYFGNFFCFIDKTKNEITGISERWNPKIRLHVKKAPNKQKPYTSEDITFYNNNITLSGMLYQPKHALGFPPKYVILIHGSGAQDRYSPYYISLGYSLAKRGIGVLLFDKRGTGLSTGNFEISSMQDLAGDAVAALNYLKNRSDIEKSEIGFLGTSQGGWIASIAANRSTDCNFLILNVGPAVSVFEQDIHRVKYSMQGDGWNQTAIDSAISYTKLYFHYLSENSPVTLKNLENQAKQVSRKEWAEYINIPNNKDFIWWRNNNYNPEVDLNNLKCRTLSIFGEYDPLVPPDENLNKMNEYLSNAGIDFEIKIIEGTLHDMRTFQELNGDNWNWPNVYWKWRIQPYTFIDNITQFLNKN